MKLRWPRSHYVRHLEAECERLRAENQALVDAVLSSVGIPVHWPKPSQVKLPMPITSGRTLPSMFRRRMESHDRKQADNSQSKGA